MPNITILDHPAGATIQVRVKPRSSRSAIHEPTEGVLVVALAAPPVDGEANAELVRLLAHATHLPKTLVRLTSGDKSRLKTLQFLGLTAADLKDRLDRASVTRR